MLALHVDNNSQFGRSLAKNAALSLAAFILFGAQVVAAQTLRTSANSRVLRAQAETKPLSTRSCVPVNGAQMLGGFAGPDDLVDINTGEICGKR